MAIEYQISQLFRSAYTNTGHVIYTTTTEDSARRTFNKLIQELPDEYFELNMIETITKNLDFTPIKSDTWLTERSARRY
jgi:hypothetical protein